MPVMGSVPVLPVLPVPVPVPVLSAFVPARKGTGPYVRPVTR